MTTSKAREMQRILQCAFFLGIMFCALGCQQVKPESNSPKDGMAMPVLTRPCREASAIELTAEAVRFAEWLRQQPCEDWLVQAYLVSAETILHNIANADTPGFKRCRLLLRDLNPSSKGEFAMNPTLGAVFEPWQQLEGPRIFDAGRLKLTGERLDLAIEGDGFFEVQMPDGRPGFTRAGDFKTASDGRLVTAHGLTLMGGFQPIAAGTTSITVSPRGDFQCDGDSGRMAFGIIIWRFARPEALKPVSASVFRETLESGQPEACRPGENGCGVIRQGFLESANVKVEDELLDFMEIQRVCISYAREARRH